MQAGSRAPFILADSSIPPGSRALVDIPFGKLYTHTELNIGAHVIHGRKDGPVLLITAALHGDEINGVEICRRLLKLPRLSQLKGTLIVVPIVNTYGFVQQSRYLPDRRDLNRSFPGSEKGSLGSRMAYQFTEQVLRTCTHAIDLHTGVGFGVRWKSPVGPVRVDIAHGLNNPDSQFQLYLNIGADL